METGEKINKKHLKLTYFSDHKVNQIIRFIK